MTQDQMVGIGRRPAIVARDDFPVGAAYAEGKRLHQHAPFLQRWLGHVGQESGIGEARTNGECAHATFPVSLPQQG